MAFKLEFLKLQSKRFRVDDDLMVMDGVDKIKALRVILTNFDESTQIQTVDLTRQENEDVWYSGDVEFA